MLDFMYFRWSENVELERPDRQSNDFWSMQTDGSSIETKDSAFDWVREKRCYITYNVLANEPITVNSEQYIVEVQP